jgi:hypothetical protein
MTVSKKISISIWRVRWVLFISAVLLFLGCIRLDWISIQPVWRKERKGFCRLSSPIPGLHRWQRQRQVQVGRHALRTHIGTGYPILGDTAKGRPGKTSRLEIGVGDGPEVAENLEFIRVFNLNFIQVLGAKY